MSFLICRNAAGPVFLFLFQGWWAGQLRVTGGRTSCGSRVSSQDLKPACSCCGPSRSPGGHALSAPHALCRWRSADWAADRLPVSPLAPTASQPALPRLVPVSGAHDPFRRMAVCLLVFQNTRTYCINLRRVFAGGGRGYLFSACNVEPCPQWASPRRGAKRARHFHACELSEHLLLTCEDFGSTNEKAPVVEKFEVQKIQDVHFALEGELERGHDTLAA